MHQIINTLLDRHNPNILPYIYICADHPSLFIRQLNNNEETRRVNISSLPVASTSTLVTGSPTTTLSSIDEFHNKQRKIAFLILLVSDVTLILKLLVECVDSIFPSLFSLFSSSPTSVIFPHCFNHLMSHIL